MIKSGKFTGTTSTKLIEYYVQNEYSNGHVIALFEAILFCNNKNELEKLLSHVPKKIEDSQWVIIQFKSEDEYHRFANKSTDLGLSFKSFLNGEMIYDSDKK